MNVSQLKVAVIHYWFMSWRGGEKVVESILKMFPQADVYTLFCDDKIAEKYLSQHNIYTSILNQPFLKEQYQKLFPLYPYAVKSLKLRQKYDLIISSESGPAKGIELKEPTPHICYIHTPMRYCWGYKQDYLLSIPFWMRPLASFCFDRLRNWDKSTVDNVDFYIANSDNIARRVKQAYQKDAEVCHPPIALEWFENVPKKTEKKHYLSYGAITPYKKIDLLIEAFNQNGKPLVIIGEGSERKKLEQKARNNIQFKGSLPLNEVLKYIDESQALLFPGEEDFGMVPLEVMARGVPVIAYSQGGSLETVLEDLEMPSKSTGIFFSEQTSIAVNNAVKKFEKMAGQFDSYWIQDYARKFGEDHFQKRFQELVHQCLGIDR